MRKLYVSLLIFVKEVPSKDSLVFFFSRPIKIIFFVYMISNSICPPIDKLSDTPLKNAVGQNIIKVEKTTLAAITQVTKKKCGVERNYYNGEGKQYKQVSNNKRENARQHPYGKNGEHAHDHVYDKEGKLIDYPTRELAEDEGKENADIL